MAISDWPAIPIDRPRDHGELVYSIAEGKAPAADIEEVSASWRRSANQFGIDPVSKDAPRILTMRELNERREALAALVFTAQPELDQLYKMVRPAGYTVLFCDTNGVAIEHRGEDSASSLFRYWGTWLGGVWSEEVEGTNGIGTCIVERRPVTVHRSQHFRSRHIDLSCSGAPVFDVDGSLLAVLDVSAIDPALSERAHALTGALTITAARAIEERNFRERFRREWIVAIAVPEDEAPTMLLAVDSGQRITGADRFARATFLLDDEMLHAGVSLWSIFERDLAPFRRKETSDVATVLVFAGSTEPFAALVTPPENASGARNVTSIALHARPRPDFRNLLSHLEPTPRVRGGLPPAAMRRIQEYVDTHLSEHVDLPVLAGIAGLSVFHFAREFKRTAGVTPHYYLLKKRVERAKTLLSRSDLSLSEIAFASGFSDQSHLTRRFRQILGATPGEVRWSQR
jgi:transcriptional regulator of acetoin/glycerol metabolism/AraC-like DNA-binding protein